MAKITNKSKKEGRKKTKRIKRTKTDGGGILWISNRMELSDCSSKM